MDHDAIAERLDAARERLLVALEALPDEALLQPGVVGSWSVRDVLVHLTVWEAEIVTALLHLDQGKAPERLLRALADRDAYNVARHEENLGRSLDAIFADLQGTRFHLEGWLESFSRRDLTWPERYRVLQGTPLWRLIAEASFAHEEKHLPAIEAFAAAWQSRRVDLSSIEISEP